MLFIDAFASYILWTDRRNVYEIHILFNKFAIINEIRASEKKYFTEIVDKSRETFTAREWNVLM